MSLLRSSRCSWSVGEASKPGTRWRFQETSRGIGGRDGGHCPGVVGGHGLRFGLGDHQYIRCTGCVRLAGMDIQRGGLFSRATLELVENVFWLEQPRS